MSVGQLYPADFVSCRLLLGGQLRKSVMEVLALTAEKLKGLPIEIDRKLRLHEDLVAQSCMD